MPILTHFILLGAIPGLMFCIIPIDGMPFRFSWELVSIWLAGAAFAAWLSSWWWRAFFSLALLQVIIHGAMITAYMELVLIGIFLAAAQGFSRLKIVHVLNAICVAGMLLSVWALLQEAEALPANFLDRGGAGPFNKNAASVFLACSLPAFCRKSRVIPPSGPPRNMSVPISWWHLSPFVLFSLLACRSGCGMGAAIAGAITFILFLGLRALKIAAGMAAVFVVSSWFFLRVDPLFGVSGIFCNDRWEAWKHIVWSFRSEAFGRGLTSFADLFPVMYATAAPWRHAHNEYLHVGFEIGLQATVLVLAYLGWFFVAAWRRRKELTHEGKIVVAGMATLAVSCAGWHTFHIAPLAVLGVAWLGLASKIGVLRDSGIEGLRDLRIEGLREGGMKKLMTVCLATVVLIGICATAHAGDRKTREITFLASGTRTAATAQSTGFSVGAYIEGQILVNVTAEAGTSTLDIIIETSDDNSTYYTHTTIGQITATGKTRQAITNFGKYVRINYTVGGTSFTFAVVGVFKN